MSYKKGTNQHQIKYKNHMYKTLAIFFAFWLFVLFVRHVDTVIATVTPEPVVDASIVSPVGPSATPIPSPTTPPINPNVSEREENIRIIKKVWRRDWETGVAIATCESGLRAKAFNGANTNGSADTGLFQVNTVHGWERAEMENPIANAGYAYALYKEQGLAPWSSSQHCWGK